MIVENLEEYQKETIKKKGIILNTLEDLSNKLIDAGCIPEFIICDAFHRELFRTEVELFSVKDKFIKLSEFANVFMLTGYRVKVITRFETGEDAFKGIELYGRCK